jgi:hypothetical protein
MGLHVSGLDDWLADLDSVPERAPTAFVAVMRRSGGNVIDNWAARWAAMPHAHIPHLARKGAFSFDVDRKGQNFALEVGVRSKWPQARIASFIEFGTLTSGPHPGGMPALEAETPRMTQALEDAAADLLEARK